MSTIEVVRRIGQHKVYKDAEGYWHVSVQLQGVWLIFGLGLDEPRLVGPAKLILRLETEDAPPRG